MNWDPQPDYLLSSPDEPQYVARTQNGGYYVITYVEDFDVDDPDRTPFFYYELEANGQVLPDQFVDFDAAKAAAEKIEEKRDHE